MTTSDKKFNLKKKHIRYLRFKVDLRDYVSMQKYNWFNKTHKKMEANLNLIFIIWLLSS